MRGLFYKKFARAVKLHAGGGSVSSVEGVGAWANDPTRRRVGAWYFLTEKKTRVMFPEKKKIYIIA